MLLDAIADHLAANGIGQVGIDIFKAQMPDSIDTAIGIFVYPGLPSDKAFGTTIICENARFNIQVRSAREGVADAYATAQNKAEAIYRLLDGAGGLNLSGVQYLYIEALHPPFPLGKDANNRELIGCNYQARKLVG